VYRAAAAQREREREGGDIHVDQIKNNIKL